MKIETLWVEIMGRDVVGSRTLGVGRLQVERMGWRDGRLRRCGLRSLVEMLQLAGHWELRDCRWRGWGGEIED